MVIPLLAKRDLNTVFLESKDTVVVIIATWPYPGRPIFFKEKEGKMH